MFNLLLALISGILIGWSFHAFFMELNAPNILKNEINISASEKKEQIIEPLKIKAVTNKKEIISTPKELNTTSQLNPFYVLLEKGLFSDAMALYIDASEQQHILYRDYIKNYFNMKSKKNPNKAITQMLEFIELVPEERSISMQLLELYKEQKAHQKAISFIIKLIDSATASELDTLYSDLIKISQSYIDELKTTKNFQTLVAFLEKHIELGVQSSFYIYTLAEYDVEIKKYIEATQLLKEIEFDEHYGEKAKNLLELINEKLMKNKEYAHKIPLKKEGDHFTVEVNIDNTPLTLLLDTGATLTMVNENKISSLALIKENIILETAGGDLNAQLQEAKVFSIGDINLEKFQVVSSSFEQANADGLLGMNFFKEFKFKIDQDEEVLYLSKINSSVK